MLSDQPLVSVETDPMGTALLLGVALILLVPGLYFWPYRTFLGGVAYGLIVGATATIVSVFLYARLIGPDTAS